MPDTEGFKIAIQQKMHGEERMELAMQIFYVVSGGARMTVRNRKYRMGLEDLILVNGMEPYELETEPDGVICTVAIDYSLISRMTADSAVVLSLNSLDIPNRPYADIREIFREIVYFEVFGENWIRCRRMSRLYELLDILLMHCMEREKGQKEKEHGAISDSEKMVRILSYVNANFRDSLSLRELAESMYTSTSTLSRFFKKQTGYYFAEYLNRVRLSHAVSELTDTERNITKIAMDCGFSSASAFSKLFHDAYGISPLEYRREQAEKAARQQDLEQELKETLVHRLEEIRPQMVQPLPQTDKIVSAAEGTPFRNPWNIVLNMGSLSTLTRANVQFHLLNMAKDLHMTHVKIWSVFTKDLRITDGKTKGSYNYSMVDTVLDVIAENQISVYFDFGSRTDVIIGSVDNTLVSEDVGITFESRELWEDLFEDFVKHLVHRYGREEIGRWIFDFCIDPTFRGHGDYYQDPEYDYQNVYEFAWRTLRKLSPDTKVGGPVGLPNSPNGEIEIFLRKCSESGCYPDFVSFPLLPYQPNPEKEHFTRNPDPEFEIRQLKLVKDMIAQICGRDIPIYVSDWNLSVSNRNVVNDSCARGAYFCSRAYGILQYASLCSLWVASDWVSNYFDTRTILSGSGGLLSRDSIRKPAYYAQRFLGELRGTLLYQDRNMILTMKNPRSFRVVCANPVSFNIGYYLREEEEITPENMDALIVNAPACSWDLVIEGLEEDTEYVIRTRSVNRHYGSIQDEWMRLGFEGQLTREDVKYLREICVPHLSMTREKVRNGRLVHRVVLDEQEFQFLHIFQVSEGTE